MMKINIIAVGKIKERYFAEACSEYVKRLGAFCKITVTEIAEYKCPDNPSPSDIKTTIENEGTRILGAIPSGAAVVPMCIDGDKLSSENLSKHISDLAVKGGSSICFIIGGSWGLDDRVKAKGVFRLSMSQMTFPHTLARVMLTEQLYRAFSIIKGTKYHK